MGFSKMVHVMVFELAGIWYVLPVPILRDWIVWIPISKNRVCKMVHHHFLGFYLFFRNITLQRGRLKMCLSHVTCFCDGDIANPVLSAYSFRLVFFVACQPTPPPHVAPQKWLALWSGLINHWFPVIRPAIKPLFLEGVTWPREGRLTSQTETWIQVREFIH